MKALKASVNSRLAAYAAVGTVAAVTGVATTSNAAVVYVDPADITIPNNIDGIYVNFVTGATSTTGLVGYDLNPYNNGAGLTFYGAASPSGVLATGTAGTLAVASRLTGGELIGPTPSNGGFYNQFQTTGGLFQSGGTAFLGLRFLNESTGAINYAWAEFTTAAGTGFPATLNRWAYENTGAAITAGAVPEPGTVATLAMGALGLGAAGVRRWRQGKQLAA